MGTLVISLDAELAWGFHHVDPPGDRLAQARDSWKRLLDSFERHDAPATWAVVGHLFMRDCDESHEGHPAGDGLCRTAVGDERDGGLAPDSAWFGDGLVDRVVDSPVDHEIAGHGFTHVHFGHEAMSRPFARRELDRTRAAARSRDIDVSSFVFPVNEVGYRKLLGEAGYGCYRGRAPVAFDSGVGRRVRKAAGALTDTGTPPLVHPYVDEYGLVNVPASMYLFDDLGPLDSVVEPLHGDPIVARAKRGLEAVAGSDAVLHLWLHPHNVRTRDDYRRVDSILAAASEYRERGDLSVATMADVAADVREVAR